MGASWGVKGGGIAELVVLCLMKAQHDNPAMAFLCRVVEG